MEANSLEDSIIGHESPQVPTVSASPPVTVGPEVPVELNAPPAVSVIVTSDQHLPSDQSSITSHGSSPTSHMNGLTQNDLNGLNSATDSSHPNSSIQPPPPSLHTLSTPMDNGNGDVGGESDHEHGAPNGDGLGSDDDEECEDEEDGEDDDDEDEEEPKLKYQRLGASVSGILKKDAAKCILAHEKFLVLGTASGRLYILDLNGNEILQFHPHTQQINDLSLDTSGDHVASASNDGTVVITNLFTKEVSKHAYPRSIKSVALPGQYGQNAMVALGGAEGKFIIHTKGWFSAKDHVIHSGEGPIHAIKWKGELLAWANDFGVKIYDSNTSERITHIARTDANAPQPPPPAEMFKCNLCWSKPDTLLIGWADSVKIGVVKSRGGPVHHSNSNKFGPASVAASSNRYVQIVAMFTTDYMICGIAPWGSHHLVLMAFLEEEEHAASMGGLQKRVARAPSTDDATLPKVSSSTSVTRTSISSSGNKTRSGASQRPELRIVTFTNEEISADALPIVGYENYNSQDYRLDFNPNGSGLPPVHHHAVAGGLQSPNAIGVPQQSTLNLGLSLGASNPMNAATEASIANANLEYLFYILAPQDIVVAKPRDYDDHITWLLAREKYEEALHYAKTYSSELKVHNAYEIGENFLKYLFEVEKNFTKAAEYCVKLLGNSKSLWETYIYMFVKYDKLNYIANMIPVANPTLSDTIYELVLNSYLEQDMKSSSGAAVSIPTATQGHEKLLYLLKTWSHHLYHIKHVMDNIKSRLASIEAAEKELQATPAGKAKEKEKELQERKRRELIEEKQKESESKAEQKKLITPSSAAAKAGSLSAELYPSPPPLPPISTLSLLESLGELYILNKQYTLAFDIYLRLQKKDELFKLLHTYHQILLEMKLLDERLIPILMRISLEKTLDVLLTFIERITPNQVMEQLKAAEKGYQSQQQVEGGKSNGSSKLQATFRIFQYEYLHALFKKDHSLGNKYHDEQVLLYAEFNPKDLLYFLKNSNGYLLERALESCEKYALYKEMVFLLKRMGNTPMALKLIIDELHDVKEAIAFVEENGGRVDGSKDESEGNDNSLWEELITRSLNNPTFLSDLLEHVGSHYVDLSKLIVRIPNNLEIPKLKSKLITILNDCELQQSVIKGCTNILRNDCKNLVKRLYRRRKRSIKIPVGTRCALCEVEVMSSIGVPPSDSSPSSNGIIIFFCRHVMHRTCYEGQLRAGERRATAEQLCPRCNTSHGHQPTAPPQVTSQSSKQPSNSIFSPTPSPSPPTASKRASLTSLTPPIGSASSSAGRATSSIAFPRQPSPSYPVTRSILPAPSATAASIGPQRGARTIPLPSSSNVLPAATASASTRGSLSSSTNLSAVPTRAASPGMVASSSTTPPPLPSVMNQIKPQATFNRLASNTRTSISK